MVREQLEIYGNIELYSPGMSTVMADLQIKNGIENGTFTASQVGDGKCVICDKITKKWFVQTSGLGNDNVHTWMLGAIAGDISGSIYEHHNVKEKLPENMLCTPYCTFTDDSVLTCAVAVGMIRGIKDLPDQWYTFSANRRSVRESIRDSMKEYGKKYISAGYNEDFMRWLADPNSRPYHSRGNDSAMRVSFAGWIAKSLEEAEILAELSAEITHTHPEGIKGAKAVAGAIYTLKKGGSKDDVREYVSKYYSLDFTLDEIREDYKYDSSCEGSVPQAVMAFLEGESFADVLANAVSIGGDSNTICAVAGSIAEVIYPMSQDLRGRIIEKLDEILKKSIIAANDYIFDRFVDVEK